LASKSAEGGRRRVAGFGVQFPPPRSIRYAALEERPCRGSERVLCAAYRATALRTPCRSSSSCGERERGRSEELSSDAKLFDRARSSNTKPSHILMMPDLRIGTYTSFCINDGLGAYQSPNLTKSRSPHIRRGRAGSEKLASQTRSLNWRGYSVCVTPQIILARCGSTHLWSLPQLLSGDELLSYHPCDSDHGEPTVVESARGVSIGRSGALRCQQSRSKACVSCVHEGGARARARARGPRCGVAQARGSETGRRTP
jgi:hypothetical protein